MTKNTATFIKFAEDSPEYGTCHLVFESSVELFVPKSKYKPGDKTRQFVVFPMSDGVVVHACNDEGHITTTGTADVRLFQKGPTIGSHVYNIEYDAVPDIIKYLESGRVGYEVIHPFEFDK